jgi:hypothetical protein
MADEIRMMTVAETLASARCRDCGRRFRDATDQHEWSFHLRRGAVDWFKCPDCQTLEDRAEIEVHDSLADYTQTTVTDGRLSIPLKDDN